MGKESKDGELGIVGVSSPNVPGNTRGDEESSSKRMNHYIEDPFKVIEL